MNNVIDKKDVSHGVNFIEAFSGFAVAVLVIWSVGLFYEQYGIFTSYGTVNFKCGAEEFIVFITALGATVAFFFGEKSGKWQSFFHAAWITSIVIAGLFGLFLWLAINTGCHT